MAEDLEARIKELEANLQTKEEEMAQIKSQLQTAAAKYRLLLLSAAPEIPEELVKGESIEEVEATFKAAREVVDRVKTNLQTKLLAERVPPGAPPRTPIDLSTLSPKEKIVWWGCRY